MKLTRNDFVFHVLGGIMKPLIMIIKYAICLFIIRIIINVYSGEWGGSSNGRIPLMSSNTSEIKTENFQPIHVLPHAIVIGAGKCGTTVLIEMMRDIYPNVRAAKGEPKFFSRQERYKQGIERYKQRLPPMEGPQDIIIEKSPQYFISSEAASRIYKDSPKSKLILIVCDPVRKVFSSWLQSIHDKWITKETINKGVVNFLTLENGKLDTSKYIVKQAQYVDYIKFWFHLFPQEQILIIDGQALVENPYPEFVKIEQFLGLPNLVKNSTFFSDEKTNFQCWLSYTRGTWCMQEDREDKTKGRKHPETKGEIKILVDKLREYFIPLNEEFFNFTGRRFNWPMNEA